MGFGRKVGAFLGLVPDEGRDYAEVDEFDHDYTEHRGRSVREGVRELDDFEGPSYERRSDPGYRPEPSFRSGGRGGYAEPVIDGALAVKPDLAPRREPEYNPVSTATGRPATVKLTGFAEARVIGEKYRDGQSVILDMTDMSDSDARRLVDFSAGLAFSLRGSIDRVAPKVFMLLPPDADVAAAARAAGYGR